MAWRAYPGPTLGAPVPASQQHLPPNQHDPALRFCHTCSPSPTCFPALTPALNLCPSPDLEAFLRRKYVSKDFAAGTWPPPPEALADGPEVQAVLAECLPADRAAELRAAAKAATAAAAAAAAAEAEEQVRQEAAKRAAAAAVNLMDFDAEPAEPAVVGNAELALAVVDPMRSLEEVFAAPAAQDSQGECTAPACFTLHTWAGSQLPAALHAGTACRCTSICLWLSNVPLHSDVMWVCVLPMSQFAQLDS